MTLRGILDVEATDKKIGKSGKVEIPVFIRYILTCDKCGSVIGTDKSSILTTLVFNGVPGSSIKIDPVDKKKIDPIPKASAEEE